MRKIVLEPLVLIIRGCDEFKYNSLQYKEFHQPPKNSQELVASTVGIHVKPTHAHLNFKDDLENRRVFVYTIGTVSSNCFDTIANIIRKYSRGLKILPTILFSCRPSALQDSVL